LNAKEPVLKGIIPQERIGMRPDIRIKLEVDTNPPPGFATEEKLLLRPLSVYTKCFTAPDLFAGRIHALPFRSLLRFGRVIISGSWPNVFGSWTNRRMVVRLSDAGL
jgi:hypothetical protein